jgi:EPS-associated MarR family transcriptional regulator
MPDIHSTIKLLEHLEKNPHSTQRELVETLDISLGKVNFLINSLSEKGIIKLERFKKSKNKRGYLYLLTPKGISEKTRMTVEFLKRKTEEYEKLKIEIIELRTKVNSLN